MKIIIENKKAAYKIKAMKFINKCYIFKDTTYESASYKHI